MSRQRQPRSCMLTTLFLLWFSADVALLLLYVHSIYAIFLCDRGPVWGNTASRPVEPVSLLQQMQEEEMAKQQQQQQHHQTVL